MFHDFFVIYGIADVDVAVEGNGAYGGVEVDHVGGLALGMEVRVYSLHEGGLSGAWGDTMLGYPYQGGVRWERLEGRR